MHCNIFGEDFYALSWNFVEDTAMFKVKRDLFIEKSNENNGVYIGDSLPGLIQCGPEDKEWVLVKVDLDAIICGDHFPCFSAEDILPLIGEYIYNSLELKDKNKVKGERRGMGDFAELEPEKGLKCLKKRKNGKEKNII